MAVFPAERPGRAGRVTGLAVFLLLAVAVLLWAKWAPYTGKVRTLSASGAWTGTSLLDGAGIAAGSTPSWHAAWSFTTAYGLAVWRALVAALVIAAAAESLVPRSWLVRMLTRRRPVTSALAGGLAAMPSMMCTCCTAPVAVSLRRSGVPTAAVVAYWLGNPLLNPAVLVFLALVAPWQWAVTRLLVGALLVVGGSALVARLTGRRTPVHDDLPAVSEGSAPSTESLTPGTASSADDGFRLVDAPRRFARALAHLAVILVPEYLVVVLLVGAFAGWLMPLSASSPHQPAAIGAAVVLGTLLVIPTGAEIPLAQGLVTAGFGAAVAGALLVTLPGVSLPSLLMVGRALSWRVTLLTAAAVAAGGIVAAALLSGLT